MKCSEIKPVLSDYLADALNGDARLRVEGHLQGCGVCSKELAGMRGMIAELGRIGRVSAPPDFLAGVLRKAERNKSAGSANGWFRILFSPPKIKIPLQLTAMAVLCMLVLHVVPYRADRTEAPNVATQSTTVVLHVASAVPLPPEHGSSDGGPFLDEASKPAPASSQTFSATPPRRARSLSASPEEKTPEPQADFPAGEETFRMDAETPSSEENAPGRVEVFLRDREKAKDLLPRDVSLEERIRAEIVKLAERSGGVPTVETSAAAFTQEESIVRIALPSENRKDFLDRLESLGVVETPPAPISNKLPETVVVEIRIVYTR
jgi:hypothetical protein